MSKKDNIAPTLAITLDKSENAILFKEELLFSKQNTADAIRLLKESIDRYVPFREKYSYSITEYEYYDSLAYRFIKSVEISICFFSACELYLFSEKSENLEDRLLKMQRIGLISDIAQWQKMRDISSRIILSASHNGLKSAYANIVGVYWLELERLSLSINSIKS